MVAAIVIALDQWSKQWVVAHLQPGEPATVRFLGISLASFLRWTYEQNTHGAFGFFGSNMVLLIAMAVLVLVIFWFSFRESAHKSLVVRIAFGMIVGGAIGNIVDRLHYKFVVDFIDFFRIWPNIFNVADACITSGVILLILSSLVTRRRA